MSERGNRLLRFLDYWGGIPLCLLTSAGRKLHHAVMPERVERLAILCQGAIGDLLLLSALVDALYKKFPQGKIDLLLSNSNGQAAELIPHIHAALIFPVKNPLQPISYLRRQKYDILFDASAWSRLGAIISNCSGAKYTVGFASAGQMRHFGYDKIVPHGCGSHEKDNFLALARALWKDMDGDCALEIPEQNELLQVTGAEKFVCMHMWPGGIKSWLKEWPEERWRELCVRLSMHGYRIYLTGGKSDRDKTEAFVRKYFKGTQGVYSLAGKYKLKEMAFVLQKAKALVSVNTGIMHLGALTGVPTVGLHGPTNPLRWGPLGKSCISLLPRDARCAYLDLGFEYPRGAKNVMGLIGVEEVLQALEKLGVELVPKIVTYAHDSPMQDP